MAVAYNKFDCFVQDIGRKVHNLNTDSIKLYLTNTAPVVTNTVFGTPAEITAGNGYVAGGLAISNAYSSSGILTGVGSITITAAGGNIGPFRYVVMYNSTPGSKPLISWWDYGSAITITNGNQFVINLPSTIFQIGFTPPAGLVGWWDMGALTGSDGDPITLINDKSGSGMHLNVVETGAPAPQVAPVLKTAFKNGRNIARFVSANNNSIRRLNSGGVNGCLPLEQINMTIVVARAWTALATTVSFEGLITFFDGNAGYGYVLSVPDRAGSDKEAVLRSNDRGYSTNTTPVTLNQWDVDTWVLDSTHGSWATYRNGVAADTGAMATLDYSGTKCDFALGVFYAYPNGSSFGPASVDVGEIMIFDHVLSSGDRTTAEQLLIAKWT